MRYWNTGDEPTNANLSYLESLDRTWPNISADRFTDKICAVIGVEKMLPRAVRMHFQFPYLFIGKDAYVWSDDRLSEKDEELCAAISEGLDRVEADETLKKGGGANFDDRPSTKGEEILAAVKAYSNYRGHTELNDLRMAISGTRLHHKMNALDKWLARKRPSPGGRPIEYEIVSVLGDIRRYASDFHGQPASYNFQPKGEQAE